jgi:hypothetical protein
MLTILHSPFFLLFCATSGTGAFLAHRLFVLKIEPGFRDRALSLIAALQSLGLSLATYQIRQGTYANAHIDPAAATLVAGLTGIGIAVVCVECMLATREAADI